MIKYFSLVIVVLLTFFSCKEKKTECKEKLPKNVFEVPVNLNLGTDSNDCLAIKYSKRQYLMEIMTNKKWSWSFFLNRRNGDYLEMSLRNSFDDMEQYFFDKNHTLIHTWKYFKEPDGLDRLDEIYAYKNGVIDRDNSMFVQVDVLSKNDQKIKLQIEFVSGYKYVESELYFGERIQSLKQAKTLNKLKFKQKLIQIELDKKDVVFNDTILEFGYLIRRTTDSKISGFVTTMPDKNIKTFAEFIYVRRIIK